jgi:hypothetical protein
MFGLRSSRSRARGGAFDSTNLRRAALAGAGLLALQWWRKRQSGRASETAGRRADEGGTPVNPF